MENKMRFIIATTLVAISTGVLGTDDNCNQHFPEKCAPEGDIEFPETEKAYDETCPILVNLYKCMQEHAVECGSDNLEDITAYLELLEDVCRKDSRLYKALASNTGCIKKSIVEECSDDIYTVYKTYRHSMEREASSGEISDEIRKKLFCMVQAYEVLCASNAVAQCGETVKDAVLELAHRTDYMEKKKLCPRNVRGEAVKDIPVLQISVFKKLQLEELLLLEN
ncbi:hypothetical protein X975_11014, partial [Stegodyphus mimosarum]